MEFKEFENTHDYKKEEAYIRAQKRLKEIR